MRPGGLHRRQDGLVRSRRGRCLHPLRPGGIGSTWTASSLNYIAMQGTLNGWIAEFRLVIIDSPICSGQTA